MSEEEIIEILEDRDMFIDTLYENYRQSAVKPFDKAIQGLLDLYQKEKMNSSNLSEQLNKEKETSHFLQSELDQANAKIIEEREKNKEIENADLTTVYMNGFYDGEKKWKDKIKERLNDYTEKAKMPLVNSQSIREYTFGIRAFQRLLEERN